MSELYTHNPSPPLYATDSEFCNLHSDEASLTEVCDVLPPLQHTACVLWYLVLR